MGRRTRRTSVVLVLVLGVGVMLLAACSSGRETTSAHPAGPPTLETRTRHQAPPPAGPTSQQTPIEVGDLLPRTERGDLLGRWQVVAVATGPVSQDAVRGLTVWGAGRRGVALGYSDGVNGHTVTYRRLGEHGRLGRGGHLASTLVACASDTGCERPSGFGVHDLGRLRLTVSGDLVMVDRRGRISALYERVGP